MFLDSKYLQVSLQHIRNHFLIMPRKAGAEGVAPPCARVKKGVPINNFPLNRVNRSYRNVTRLAFGNVTECLASLQVMILAIRKKGVAVNKPIAIKRECLHFVHSEQRFRLRWDWILLICAAVKCLFLWGSSQTCHEHFQHFVQNNASLFEKSEARIPSYYLHGWRIWSSGLLRRFGRTYCLHI